MTLVDSIETARPISTPDWGGAKSRIYVTAAEAEVAIDLDSRVAILRPKRGRPIVIPLENVKSWQPQMQAPKASKSRQQQPSEPT